MRRRDRRTAEALRSALRSYSAKHRRLAGIRTERRRIALIEQMLESVRRIRYVSVIGSREICPQRADPASDLFDPIRAALLARRNGAHDEACWLVFYSVHFGRNARGGWRLARDVYGALGAARLRWDWETTSANVAGFRRWLAAHERTLRDDTVCRGFGNHRKYQSLEALDERGTGAAFATYVDWVRSCGNHAGLVAEALREADGNAKWAFGLLYRSMSAVASFGRTAKFDYLTMLAKTGLADIEADSAYLSGATGPLSGARLLFGGSTKARFAPNQLDDWLRELDLELGIGMQALEDSLCNWQKSPERFQPFRS